MISRSEFGGEALAELHLHLYGCIRAADLPVAADEDRFAGHHFQGPLPALIVAIRKPPDHLRHRQPFLPGLSSRMMRGFEGGPEGIEIIAVGADRPEGGDGEMVHDWWTD